MTIRVHLFRPHTHRGILYPAGSEVDLPEAAAKWLLDVEGARRAEIIRNDERIRERKHSFSKGDATE